MVPRTLAENAGMDVARVLSALTEKYTENWNCGMGVDLEVGVEALCEVGGHRTRCHQGGTARLGRVRHQAQCAATRGECRHYHPEGRPDYHGEGGGRTEAARSAEGRGIELGILVCLRKQGNTENFSCTEKRHYALWS